MQLRVALVLVGLAACGGDKAPTTERREAPTRSAYSTKRAPGRPAPTHRPGSRTVSGSPTAGPSARSSAARSVPTPMPSPVRAIATRITAMYEVAPLRAPPMISPASRSTL